MLPGLDARGFKERLPVRPVERAASGHEFADALLLPAKRHGVGLRIAEEEPDSYALPGLGGDLLVEVREGVVQEAPRVGEPVDLVGHTVEQLVSRIHRDRAAVRIEGDQLGLARRR